MKVGEAPYKQGGVRMFGFFEKEGGVKEVQKTDYKEKEVKELRHKAEELKRDKEDLQERLESFKGQGFIIDASETIDIVVGINYETFYPKESIGINCIINEEKRMKGFKVEVIYREDSQMSGVTIEKYQRLDLSETFEIKEKMENLYADVELTKLELAFVNRDYTQEYIIDVATFCNIKERIKRPEEIITFYDYEREKEFNIRTDNIMGYSVVD